MSPKRRKLLAVSSGGGHWVQLLRLRPAFAGYDVTYATVRSGYRSDVNDGRFIVIRDSNRTSKLRVALCACVVFLLIVRVRPDIVISTGAAPGYFAVRFGRWFGATTVWLDSVANVEELSLSGQMAGRHVHLWLTQWQHLADKKGPKCFGSVL